MSKCWHAWEKISDLPPDLRDQSTLDSLVQQATADQRDQIVQAVVKASTEAVLEALQRERVAITCQRLVSNRPDLPKRAIFTAVAILLGRTEVYVRRSYYGGDAPRNHAKEM